MRPERMSAHWGEGKMRRSMFSAALIGAFLLVASVAPAAVGVSPAPAPADPVAKFLPAFKGQRVSVARADSELARLTYTNAAADREMTVQDLLRHTSGLAYGEITQNAPVKDAYTKAGVYLPGVRDYDSRDMTPAEQAERVGAAPLAHQPGTVWEYSLN